MKADLKVLVEMFSRPGCHLCDSAADVIRRVQKRVDFQFDVVNIETDPDLESRYGTRIPVIQINGRPFGQYRVDPAELEQEVRREWNK